MTAALLGADKGTVQHATHPPQLPTKEWPISAARPSSILTLAFNSLTGNKYNFEVQVCDPSLVSGASVAQHGNSRGPTDGMMQSTLDQCHMLFTLRFNIWSFIDGITYNNQAWAKETKRESENLWNTVVLSTQDECRFDAAFLVGKMVYCVSANLFEALGYAK